MYESVFEVILVAVIVAAVLALAGRSVYRKVTGKEEHQCCGGCDSCVCGSENTRDR
ncbi:FeoB-associated Cys-rich membrane protein [Syntrophorhabdus aromaticivorans]|uniref:FeoB-associated Cys-rich membrane protein n=1 Tax=Syntrophorhabdus aromaticivorans TaxID=328301 RepID=UPI00042696AE|nr:FeoB-associated Cys-rich membrane protein [Syntrophorhabdus aromaticivorans]HBA54423.1 FeoB-associated Cys-rich membrane protein [Syntrophorhabdus aromaticivorans]